MSAVATLSERTGIQRACAALGVPRSTLYRHRTQAAAPPRPLPPARPSPPQALSPGEREQALEILHSPRFVDASPTEVYAALLDEDRYLCSIRTMYRLLACRGEVRERRNQLRHPHYRKPELVATGPNQVWSWDITKLRGPAKWIYYYLYVMLDIFSRYAVGWLLAERESELLAQRLLSETTAKHPVAPGQLTLHADRGPSMTAKSVAQLLADLGIVKSHSRPHTSNDNPFSEAQLKTLKYHPLFPDRFGSLEDAQLFCRGFFPWYNYKHHHSGLALLTPADVHFGRAPERLAHRAEVLRAAYAAHPDRFHSLPRPKQLPAAVWINPPQEDTPTAVP
jgi:transposase InsO family protein